MSNKEKMEQLRTIFEESIKANKYPQSMRNVNGKINMYS